MNRLNPLNDYIFLKSMGEKGDEEELLTFLNAILYRTQKNKLESIEIIENKKLTAELIGDKTSILDVRAVAEDNTKVNVEVQLRNLGNMDRRSLFYWSREFSKSLEAGQDYKDLPKVIVINIINFDFIDLSDFHTTFHLWEDNNKEYMLTDALEMHFINMVKFRKLREKDFKNNSLHRWLTFFDDKTPEDILKEVVNMDSTIQKVNEKIEFLSNDKEALRAYHLREMSLSDFTSGMNHAREEGIEIGIKQGIEKEKMQIAREMLEEGIELEIISKITKLSIEKIQEIM